MASERRGPGSSRVCPQHVPNAHCSYCCLLLSSTVDSLMLHNTSGPCQVSLIQCVASNLTSLFECLGNSCVQLTRENGQNLTEGT